MRDVVGGFIFSSPRCRRAALPSDAGDCQSLFVAARAVGGRRWLSSLLKLLLLTRQAAEHGAVEPQRNELPSFRARRGLSIVPRKSTFFVSSTLSGKDSNLVKCDVNDLPKPLTWRKNRHSGGNGNRPRLSSRLHKKNSTTMNRVISLLLIVVALASSLVQGFAPSSLGGVSGGELTARRGLPS